MCDNGYRQRDPRYADQAKHKAKPDALWDKSEKAKEPRTASRNKRYASTDVTEAPDRSHCLCPAGKCLYRNGGECTINGFAATRYNDVARDCMPCDQRPRCLSTPETTKVRQVAFFRGKRGHTESHTESKRRIDFAEGKRMIAARFATVEPAFQHLAKHRVGVVAAFVGAFGVFVIHSGADNHLARGVVPEEQSVLLEELGPEPVLVIVTSRPTLAVLRSRRIVRDYIERQFGDRSQGRRVDPP